MTRAALRLALILVAGACARQPDSKSRESVRLAIGAHPKFSLVCLAQKEGLFAANGLNVNVSVLPTGWDAVQALQNHKADFAGASVYAFAKILTMPSKPPRVLGELYSGSVDFAIVSRNARKVSTPKALEGRRIAFTPMVSTDAMFETYLAVEGVARDKVTVVELGPKEAVAALKSGNVDAVFATDEILAHLSEGAEANQLTFLRGSQNPMIIVLLAESSWLRGESTAYQKVLRALIQAEPFLESPSERSIAHLSDCFPDFDRDMLRKTLGSPGFRVVASEQLRFHYGQASDWLRRRSGVYAPVPPNFDEVFFKPALLKANASRVLLR